MGKGANASLSITYYPLLYSGFLMGWLKRIPQVSLLLLLATYGVFGWLYGSLMAIWATKIHLWQEWLTFSVALGIFYGIGLLAIIILINFFTAPIALLTLGMGNWFRADSKAIIAIAISIVIFAIVIEHPAALARFLILSAAAMLFRLDLQTEGFSYRVAQLILVFLSLVAFTTGVGIFYATK